MDLRWKREAVGRGLERNVKWEGLETCHGRGGDRCELLASSHTYSTKVLDELKHELL